jgi:UDP-galactopyranose mutase
MKILIVGAGLFGAVCAHELSKAGHSCVVIDKRNHIGGNVYTKYNPEADCHEHVYGAHIFHTNSKKIWEYINQFASFNHFVNRVKVINDGRLYSFPINLFTLYQVFGVTTPQSAKLILEKELIPNPNPANMEEYCLSAIGPTLYHLFIEGYTEKQWGRHPRDMPADVIKRLPVRMTFDDNYFTDQYQGIPIGGYTAIIEKMLASSTVELGIDFLQQRNKYLNQFDHIIYTGPIDTFFDYQFGPLEYRSLRFEKELLPINDFQGNAVVNYTQADIPWTRILEHKHFDLSLKANNTLITREYPAAWKPGDIEYYPVNDSKNNETYKKYRELADQLAPKIHFGGRLGEYRYYDMHQVIGSALVYCERFLNR